MNAYSDQLGIKELMGNATQSLRLYLDNLIKVADDANNAAIYYGANESNFQTRVKMIKRKLVLKYFGIDSEYYMSSCYGKWKDLKDLEFYKEDNNGSVKI